MFLTLRPAHSIVFPPTLRDTPSPFSLYPFWFCAQSRSSRNWLAGRKELPGRRGRCAVRGPKKRVCEVGPGFRGGGLDLWAREEQGGKPQGREGQTTVPSPPYFAQQPTSFFSLSATSNRVAVAGRKRKGKLSQDRGFLYILLPEQRRGRKGQERDPGSDSSRCGGQK